MRFPCGPDSKEFVCEVGDVGDTGLIPGSGRSPGEGNGYPLQDSCLENSMDRGTWRAAVMGPLESSTVCSQENECEKDR